MKLRTLKRRERLAKKRAFRAPTQRRQKDAIAQWLRAIHQQFAWRQSREARHVR